MNSEKLYIVVDGLSRVVIYITNSPDQAQFIQHNIMDTMLHSPLAKDWYSLIGHSSNVPEKTNSFIIDTGFQYTGSDLVKTTPTTIVTENIQKSKMLAKGFKFVNNILDNTTTDVHSTSYFLTLNDIMMFPDITDLADDLSYAANIDIEIAKKQLILEKDSLQSVYKYRKKALWLHCMELLKVNTEDEYAKWMVNVRNKSSGAGLL